MKAPYKRGTKLTYVPCRDPQRKFEVKYVKWLGIMRSALIVIRLPCGHERTAHGDEVKEAEA